MDDICIDICVIDYPVFDICVTIRERQRRRDEFYLHPAWSWCMLRIRGQLQRIWWKMAGSRFCLATRCLTRIRPCVSVAFAVGFGSSWSLRQFCRQRWPHGTGLSCCGYAVMVLVAFDQLWCVWTARNCILVGGSALRRIRVSGCAESAANRADRLSLTLFDSPALPLGFLSAPVLLPWVRKRLIFAADSALWRFSCLAISCDGAGGTGIDVVSFGSGQLRSSWHLSCRKVMLRSPFLC